MYYGMGQINFSLDGGVTATELMVSDVSVRLDIKSTFIPTITATDKIARARRGSTSSFGVYIDIEFSNLSVSLLTELLDEAVNGTSTIEGVKITKAPSGTIIEDLGDGVAAFFGDALVLTEYTKSLMSEVTFEGVLFNVVGQGIRIIANNASIVSHTEMHKMTLLADPESIVYL